MTKHECVVIMAFTGVAMLKGNDLDIFYEYVAKIFGRPVYTHEIAMLSEEIKEAARNDFAQLCRNASAKPKTNADRIRQMTDEELFVFLNEITDCCFSNNYCDNCPMKYSDEQYYRCDIEAWLKQEVSEDVGTD